MSKYIILDKQTDVLMNVRAITSKDYCMYTSLYLISSRFLRKECMYIFDRMMLDQGYYWIFIGNIEPSTLIDHINV
jgi:hypothetical protein